jgi:hypothetical protein
VSSKEGMFSKEGGHKSHENFYVSFGPNYFSVLGGRTVRIRTVQSYSLKFGKEIEVVLGMIF